MKISFNTIKNCEKVEIVYVTQFYVTTTILLLCYNFTLLRTTTIMLQLHVTTTIQHYFNVYQYYHIFSMIIQNRTTSVALACTQKQTSKKSTQNLNITNSIEVTIIGAARGGQGARTPKWKSHQ